MHPIHTTTRSPLPFQPVSQWEYAGSLRHDQLTNGSERDGPAKNFWPMGALAGGGAVRGRGCHDDGAGGEGAEPGESGAEPGAIHVSGMGELWADSN